MTDVVRSLLHGRRLVATLTVLVLAAVSAVALVLAGSGQAQPAASGRLNEEPEEEPDADPTPVGTAALTGMPVHDEEVLERPVVAAKIENTAAARPQAGLDTADIVFEELVEGGVTRFLALFQSEVPDSVGPIRSGRPEDAVVLPAYDPMLYFSGARAEVIAQIRSAGIDFLAEDGAVMRRDPGRSAPHNVFAAGEAMFSYAADRVGQARPGGFAFAEQAPAGGGTGAEVTVAMSPVSVTSFQFDGDAGLYRRFQNGSPQQVTGGGEVGADNVVVLGMRIGDGGCCDTSGSRYTATTVHGEGDAVVYRDGQRYEGRWSKSSPGGHFTLTTVGGDPMPLKPGRSWVLFAPTSALP